MDCRHNDLQLADTNGPYFLEKIGLKFRWAGFICVRGVNMRFPLKSGITVHVHADEVGCEVKVMRRPRKRLLRFWRRIRGEDMRRWPADHSFVAQNDYHLPSTLGPQKNATFASNSQQMPTSLNTTNRSRTYSSANSSPVRESFDSEFVGGGYDDSISGIRRRHSSSSHKDATQHEYLTSFPKLSPDDTAKPPTRNLSGSNMPNIASGGFGTSRNLSSPMLSDLPQQSSTNSMAGVLNNGLKRDRDSPVRNVTEGSRNSTPQNQPPKPLSKGKTLYESLSSSASRSSSVQPVGQLRRSPSPSDEPDPLSKRLQIYALGVKIRIFVNPRSIDTRRSSFHSKNSSKSLEQQQKRGNTTGDTRSSNKDDDDVAQAYKAAQKSAAKLAQSITRMLRAAVYATAWISPWLEILINGVQIMVSDDDTAAKSGEGFTIQVRTIKTRADAAMIDGNGPSFSNFITWIKEAYSFISGKIAYWYTGRKPKKDTSPSKSKSRPIPRPSSPNLDRPETPMSDKFFSLRDSKIHADKRYIFGKYMVSIDIKFTGFEIMSGVDSTTGLYNSTWELVKIRLLKGFMVGDGSGGIANTRKSVSDAFQASQDSIISLEAVTDFFGSPAEVLSRLDLSSARIKGDGLESVITDFIAMIKHYQYLHPNTDELDIASSFEESRFASWKARMSDSTRAGLNTLAGSSGKSTRIAEKTLSDQFERILETIAMSSIPQVKMHFTHSLFSNLSLRYIGFSIFMKDFVFDLPIVNKIPAHERLVTLPSTIRFRERDASVTLEWGIVNEERIFDTNSVHSETQANGSHHQGHISKRSGETSTRNSSCSSNSEYPSRVSLSATENSEMSSDSDSKRASSKLRRRISRGRGLSGFMRNQYDLSIESCFQAMWELGSMQVTTSSQDVSSSKSVVEELNPSMTGLRIESARAIFTLPLYTTSLAQPTNPVRRNLDVELNVQKPSILMDLKTRLAFDYAMSWLDGLKLRISSGIPQDISVPHFNVGHGASGFGTASVGQNASMKPGTNSKQQAIRLAWIKYLLRDAQCNATINQIRYGIRPKSANASRVERGSSSTIHDLVMFIERATGSVSLRFPLSDHLSKGLLPFICPEIDFEFKTTPIIGRWVDVKHDLLSQMRRVPEDGAPGWNEDTVIRSNRGPRVVGKLNLVIGKREFLADSPRCKLDVEVVISDLVAAIRHREYMRWISQLPIWETCSFAQDRANESISKNFKQKESENPVPLAPLEERRKEVQATIRVSFHELRVTSTFCDNDEDKMSDIQHGIRLVFRDGGFETRINGGVPTLTSSFALKPDSPTATYNLHAHKVALYLLDTSPRPRVAGQFDTRPPSTISVCELRDWKEFAVERHIAFDNVSVDMAFHSHMHGQPKIVVDINSSLLRSVHSVSSIYRLYVFINHIIYWKRRTGIGKAAVGYVKVPTPSSELYISVKADELQMTGDLPIPDVHTNDMVMVEEGAKTNQKNNLVLRLPKAKFDLVKSKERSNMDIVMCLEGTYARLYGQPINKFKPSLSKRYPMINLNLPQIRMYFPNSEKREAESKKNGTRLNNADKLIDIIFSQGSINIANDYDIHQAIDGFILLQKGSKRVAREMYKVSKPAVPESFSELKPGEKALGNDIIKYFTNPKTWLPGYIRPLISEPPKQPIAIPEPEDLPTIRITGNLLTTEFEDDPFETALSRIYQVGKREQVERLGRLSAFEKRAAKMRQEAKEELHETFKDTTTPTVHVDECGMGFTHQGNPSRAHISKATTDTSSVATPHAPGRFRSFRRSSHIKSSSQSVRQIQGSNHPTAEHLPFESLPSMRTGHSFHTYASSVAPDGESRIGDTVDVDKESRRFRPRKKSNAIEGLTPLVDPADQFRRSRFASWNSSSSQAFIDSNGSLNNPTNLSTESIDKTRTNSIGTYRSLLKETEDDINEARHKLYEFESKNWVKKIRGYMYPPFESGGDIRKQGSSNTNSSKAHEGKMQQSESKPPYPYTPSSWRHPTVHLSSLRLSPVRAVLEAPLSLLEFNSVEDYLRDMDEHSPRGIDWLTLIPWRIKVKCGSLLWQIRDFPFPFIYVPDPFVKRYADNPKKRDSLDFENFRGGIDISSTVVIAEPAPGPESIRNFTIPIGYRDPGQPPFSDPILRWSLAKSLVFPRIYSTFSVLLNVSPTLPLHPNTSLSHLVSPCTLEEKVSLNESSITKSILISWGTCMQSSVTALSQRFESLSKAAPDVSPSIGWWDKLRSRLFYRGRVATFDIHEDMLDPSIPESEIISLSRISSSGESLPTLMKEATRLDSLKVDCPTGDILFYFRGGRDPYDVTDYSRGLLISYRGAVRISIGEDKEHPAIISHTKNSSGTLDGDSSGADDPTPPIHLNEFVKLRCLEFLIGLPMIRSIHKDIIDPTDEKECLPDTDSLTLDLPSDTESPEYSRLLSDPKLRSRLIRSVRRKILNERIRFAIGSKNSEHIFRKVILRLSKGVRFGIGLCAEAIPNSEGKIVNQWKIIPKALEHMTPEQLATHDSFAGFRSLFLHCQFSLQCPFEIEPRDPKSPKMRRPKRFSKSHRAKPPIYLSKPYFEWSPSEVDAFCSPFHKIGYNEMDVGSSDNTTPEKDTEDDQGFFQPFSIFELPKDLYREWGALADFKTYEPQEHTKRYPKLATNDSTVYCEINSSPGVINHITAFTPLFASNMILPIRKGNLYPEIEKADIKIGQCLRSTRVVLNLDSVEIAHTQRDIEMKELETREFEKLGYKIHSDRDAESDTDKKHDDDIKPRGVGDSSNTRRASRSITSGAKAEGVTREAKARMTSAKFSLTMIQKTVKLSAKVDKVVDKGNANTTSEDIKSLNDYSFMQSSIDGNDDADADTIDSVSDIPKPDDEKEALMGLRWSLDDADTEIDNLDLRLLQMHFWLPLFIRDIRPASERPKYDKWNGLTLAKDAAVQVTQQELGWFYITSIHDIDSIDLSSAVFDKLTMAHVLWAPHVIYFMQHPEVSQLLQLLHDPKSSRILSTLPKSTEGLVSQTGSRQHRSSTIAVPRTVKDTGSAHKANISQNLQGDYGHNRSISLSHHQPSTPSSKHSSIQKNDLQGIDPPKNISIYRRASLFRLLSKEVSSSQSKGEHTTIENKLEDLLNPTASIRNSRETQIHLLVKRGESLMHARRKVQAQLDNILSRYERRSDYNEEYIKNNLKDWVTLVSSLSSRRKLVNRCLELFGRGENGLPIQKMVDGKLQDNPVVFPQDRQNAAERILESLYRHRFILHSAYLIWNSEVRDIMMRFLYAEDCWRDIRNYISHTTNELVKNVVSGKDGEKGDKVNSRESFSMPGHESQGRERTYNAQNDAATFHGSKTSLSIKSGIRPPNSETATQATNTKQSRRHSRSHSHSSRLTDHNIFDMFSKKDGKKAHREDNEPAHQNSEPSKPTNPIESVADDVAKFNPKYSALFEFVSPQMSLAVHELTSKEAVVASIERCQVHMIDFYEKDEVSNDSNSITTDEYTDKQVVKSRTLVELDGIQLFTVDFQDFVDYPTYLIDCYYGTRGAYVKEDAVPWPPWIPIEMLLSPKRSYSDDRGSRYLIHQDAKQYQKILDRTSGIVDITRIKGTFLKNSSSQDQIAANIGGDSANADHISVNTKITDFTAPSIATSSKENAAKDTGSGNALSRKLGHRTDYYNIYLPEIYLACTSYQYITVYNIVTQLMVYSDPERAAYLDQLNAKLMTTDVTKIESITPIIREAQEKLREHLRVIRQWNSVHLTESTYQEDGPISPYAIEEQQSKSTSLLTLDRRKNTLEIYLRTAMDMLVAAQKARKQYNIRGRHSQDMVTNESTATISQLSRTGSILSKPIRSRHAKEFNKEDPMSIESRSSGEVYGSTTKSVTRKIEVYLTKVTWRMMSGESNPLFDWDIRRGVVRHDTMSDLATRFALDIDVLVVRNLDPKMIFNDIVSPYTPKINERIDFSKHKMIHVEFSELAPVGGISIVESLVIDLHPLRLQLSYDIGKRIINYLYPSYLSHQNTKQDGAFAMSSKNKRTSIASKEIKEDSDSIYYGEPAEGGKFSVQKAPGPLTRYGTTNNWPAHEEVYKHHYQEYLKTRKDSEPIGEQITIIKQRSSKNKTFIYIRVPGHKHCISYQGKKDKNVEDLRDFVFNSPTLEFSNKVESFYELMMDIKREMKGAVFQHTGALLVEKFKQLNGSKAWKKREKVGGVNKLLQYIDEGEDDDSDDDNAKLEAELTEMSKKKYSGGEGDQLRLKSPDIDPECAGFKTEVGQLGNEPVITRTLLLDPRKLMPAKLSLIIPRTISSERLVGTTPLTDSSNIESLLRDKQVVNPTGAPTVKFNIGLNRLPGIEGLQTAASATMPPAPLDYPEERPTIEPQNLHVVTGPKSHPAHTIANQAPRAVSGDSTHLPKLFNMFQGIPTIGRSRTQRKDTTSSLREDSASERFDQKPKGKWSVSIRLPGASKQQGGDAGSTLSAVTESSVSNSGGLITSASHILENMWPIKSVKTSDPLSPTMQGIMDPYGQRQGRTSSPPPLQQPLPAPPYRFEESASHLSFSHSPASPGRAWSILGSSPRRRQSTNTSSPTPEYPSAAVGNGYMMGAPPTGSRKSLTPPPAQPTSRKFSTRTFGNLLPSSASSHRRSRSNSITLGRSPSPTDASTSYQRQQYRHLNSYNGSSYSHNASNTNDISGTNGTRQPRPKSPRSADRESFGGSH
ncbi:Protein SABRE [Mycoemilia scoparia]|uniref:Protein SABRE n=1 Tax=Mycoemilia scoparia TaxID=417184 RepID=A0A9W7ZY85_9FUNG|nr:Protein SABRE [Mycoemilia scoparia]